MQNGACEFFWCDTLQEMAKPISIKGTCSFTSTALTSWFPFLLCSSRQPGCLCPPVAPALMFQLQVLWDKKCYLHEEHLCRAQAAGLSALTWYVLVSYSTRERLGSCLYSQTCKALSVGTYESVCAHTWADCLVWHFVTLGRWRVSTWEVLGWNQWVWGWMQGLLNHLHPSWGKGHILPTIISPGYLKAQLLVHPCSMVWCPSAGSWESCSMGQHGDAV